MRPDATRRLYGRLGERLREIRIASGMTQQQVATVIGTSRPSISNIESGRQHIKIDVLYRLAAALNVDVRDVLPDMEADQPVHGLEGLPEGAQEFVKNIIGGGVVAAEGRADA